MAEQAQTQGTTTDVQTLYNNQLGSMRYGYFREVGYVQISPIFDAYIGREPEPGAKMYNHDSRVFFSLSGGDIARIKAGLGMLEREEATSFTIAHEGGKGSKYITIGYILENTGLTINLVEIGENGEVTKDVYFAFNDGETTDNALILDIDETMEGSRVYVNTELETFTSFLDSLMRFINKEGQHGVAAAPARSTGGGTNRSNTNASTAPGAKRRRPIAPSSGAAARPAKAATSVDAKAAGSLFDDEQE